MEVDEHRGAPGSVTFTPLTDTLSAYASADVASLSISAVNVQPGGTGVVRAGTGDPNDAAPLDKKGPAAMADGPLSLFLI
ncbi:MAG: hypothetical protein WBX22_12080 [Silvibacterium sp.]|jgi:hypothetical protein